MRTRHRMVMSLGSVTVALCVAACSVPPVETLQANTSSTPHTTVARVTPLRPKPTPVRPSKPTPVRPASPAPPAGLCGAPANPYGYNYCGRGSKISSPAADVCSYFSCIKNFANGVGYMEECHDGMVSMSGGRRGACSYHGGELRPVTG